MDRSKILLMTTFMCLAIVGCQKRDEIAEDKPELKASDIAQALGMNWWAVQLPADLDPNDLVGVTYKQPDGSIESQGGSTNWKAGTIVKVFVWESDDSARLQYSVFNESGTLRGSLPKKSNMTGPCAPFSQGKLFHAGDVLMKFCERSLMVTSDVRPGELGLILHITKSN